MTGVLQDSFEARRKERARVRREAIERLIEESRRVGGVTDRLYWTMVHDFELAPLTTNLRQLEELGIEVPPASSLDDERLTERLWEVIEGLARLQTYLLGTDHLSDRELYDRLERQVLREQVREVPPEEGVREYIDLDSGDPATREGRGSELTMGSRGRDARLPRPRPDR